MMDLEGLRTAVGEMDEGRVNALLGGFLASQPTEEEARAVLAACQQGMDIVGERFGDGRYFVGDLIFAGSMLAGAVEKLKPLLGFGAGDFSAGTVVLGTVEGDIHFIGKNLFKTMAEAANFRVIDLGIDQPPQAFCEAAARYRPEIVGLSGLLSTAVDSMKETVAALTAAGLRKHLRVVIGGNIVNEEVCAYVGADAWSNNAYEAVGICRELVEK
ncbi:MAG: cobalamin-dependent protein [Clostridiales Family XIII bacterium]|jgi:methanogenic corrinoid protein MtbC1|nr:cobalamin-dependent protein [Clostridiales Family XIII bacterium]